MDLVQPPVENYANPKTCLFHVLFKAGALAFYILSALFFDSFVIIFVVTVLLAALDFWVVKNVSGRILVGLRWWNEVNDLGESVWKFECLDQESLSRMNKKDSWLFWWTLYLTMLRSRFKHLHLRPLHPGSHRRFSQHSASSEFIQKDWNKPKKICTLRDVEKWWVVEGHCTGLFSNFCRAVAGAGWMCIFEVLDS
ncbi:Golgi apparatus membrane protein-like protein ECHIDNA isoform X1 [Malania oleifera]|uniref:Golgi apparatus membrane protein-like protein ECHIDNA isoform X1 n=1 Tax=Malania oleifera TaxID=397392 RepID=UPI0025AEC72F|nr:Golgi apparatus membrane protein-like protein ECHIDNA isoform X1 [Malania oleifera]